MNAEQKNKLAKIYFEIGEIHGRTISKDTLITLVNTFQDLNYDLVYKEMNLWLVSGTHFPLPAHIREKILPKLNEKDNAIDAVNTLIGCVSKFGYTNPNGAEKAMGELAWETTKRFGGWNKLCETLCIENEGMIRAQLRELAQVVSKKSMRGELDETQSLPKSYKEFGVDFSKPFASIE